MWSRSWQPLRPLEAGNRLDLRASDFRRAIKPGEYFAHGLWGLGWFLSDMLSFASSHRRVILVLTLQRLAIAFRLIVMNMALGHGYGYR